MATMRELLPYMEDARQESTDLRPTPNERRLRTRDVQSELLKSALGIELGEPLFKLLDFRMQVVGDIGRAVAEFSVDGVLYGIACSNLRWYTINVVAGPFPATMMHPRKSYTSYLRQDLMLYIERVWMLQQSRAKTS